MHLVDAETLRQSLGFDDMADINKAIDASLDAATSALASLLTTDFTRQTVTELFYVLEPNVLDPAGGIGQTEFRLSNGFIVAVTAFTSAPVIANFGVSDTDLSSTIVLKKDKGVVLDPLTAYDKVYVSITYSAGFEADNVITTMYKQDQVPQWLKDAAMIQAKIVLADHPTVTEAGIKIDTQALKAQLKNIISSKLRYAPAAVLPL